MGGGELRGAPRGFHVAPFKSLFWFRDFYVFRFTSRQRCLQLRPTAASGDKAAITPPSHIYYCSTSGRVGDELADIAEH